MNAFSIVGQFEERVAKFAGSQHAVALATGTWGIFLACRYLNVKEVTLPARTFISVPMAVLHAGGTVKFEDTSWSGVYQLWPYPIWDAALRWHRGMFKGGLHVLSFHARKHLPIGEGGMVLTDDLGAADWLRRARYSGRDAAKGYDVGAVDTLGWQAYMTPEKAARGLHLMEYTRDEEDQVVEYPDLREAPLFR